MAEIICAVYKITNTITCDFYIGSSNNVKRRWTKHKSKSTWKQCPNNLLYQDFQKYGIDKFDFQILEEVKPEQLKEKEQQFIETLKPTYNSNNAKGLDVKRYKEKKKKYKKEYDNQPCCYKGEILTLNALDLRFRRAGVEQSKTEAKKYLVL